MANPAAEDKYEILEKIGHGSFGVIHRVIRVCDKKQLCRKEISYVRMSQKEREQLHAEFSILHSLRHPNIVAYYHREHLKEKQELHIYMEYCNGGDLSRVIKSLIAKNQYAEEEYVWSIFAQLVTALYRCHYGVDPPEVGKNFMGTGNPQSQKLRLKNQLMILHRDLKPDNVFLGADNSVKLGDFGLSKLMQSHDFASTYVGTPYYMSPEICAAERYTLHSDIWSLGCVIYELCARKPPFDAKTHFDLVHKIKLGRYDPIPNIYSPELANVIKSCLKTNPNHRPDTATLLQLPVVRLMRKEREVVELGRLLTQKVDEANERATKLTLQVTNHDAEKARVRAEIDSSIRREWEVKARLEIDRQVQLEILALQRRFETEFASNVQAEVEVRLRSLGLTANGSKLSLTAPPSRKPSGAHTPSEIALPLSSISTSTDDDFPSITDLTSLSFDSPMQTSTSQSSKMLPLRKSTRTPFTRARTTYDSPMDVHMASPSPMSISSLALSPRRTGAPASTLPNPQNIFAAAAEQRKKWEPQGLSPATSDDEGLGIEEEDEDEMPELPSPTRVRKTAGGAQDPFKLPAPGRPGIRRQNTAPIPRLQAQPSLFSGKVGLGNAKKLLRDTEAGTRPRSPTVSTGVQLVLPTTQPTTTASTQKSTSPTRRMSKVPMLADGAGSPTRRPSVKRIGKAAGEGGGEMLKAVTSKNMLGAGKTLVELNQNQGKVLAELGQGKATVKEDNDAVRGFNLGVGEMGPEKGEGGVRMAARLMQWESEGRRGEDVVMWDPERDEMPSPFLARKGRAMQ